MSSTPQDRDQNQEPSKNRSASEIGSFGDVFKEIAQNMRFDDETNDEDPDYKWGLVRLLDSVDLMQGRRGKRLANVRN